MAVKDYPIKTSEDEFTRLSMQSDLFRGDAEFILDRIGVDGAPHGRNGHQCRESNISA